MNNPANMLIFKTDIGKLCENCQVHKTLSNHPGIRRWSIDHEDVDRVLCIDSESLSPGAVIQMIQELGHQCTEL